MSKDLAADYLFPGVHSVGSLAVIVINLKPWDAGLDVLDKAAELQHEEKTCEQRLLKLHSMPPTTVCIALVNGEASRRRFMKLQERYEENVKCFYMLTS